MRQFIDLYTYRLKYTKINEKYVELILKQFGFLEFYNNVMETINYWFAGGIENEITKIITQKVLTSCLFGTSKSKEMLVISRDIKRSGNAKKAKIKAVLFTIFPSVSDVILRYPILKKASWILPIVWIIRWIGAIFNPEKIKNNVKRFKKYNEKTIAEYDDQLKKVGL